MAKIKKTGRHTGAIKAARQSIRRMLRNRTIRRHIRAVAKNFVETVSKDAAQARQLMPDMASAWDKAAKAGTIHWKAAARKKSRMAHRAAGQPAAVSAPKA